MKLLTSTRLLGKTSLASFVVAGSLSIVWCEDARADLGALVGQFATVKEAESARASQAVYDQLRASGCDDLQVAATVTCGGGKYMVWRNVREVVHNANALTPNNTGPTLFSLGRANITLLGRALQWCNGEELGSLGSLATRFVGVQANTLAARVTALRLGAGGFRAASNYSDNSDDPLMAAAANQERGNSQFDAPRYIGAASADETESWSKWGGFLSGSSVRGEKVATNQEDAFKFDGPTMNLGFDKRLNARWIMGVVLGYQKNNMDFATIATVEANSDLSGYSATPYLLYQSDVWFFSAAFGYQDMRFDTHRRVNYASGPLATTVVSHNTFDDSEAHARGWSSNDSLGFTIRPTAAWLIEPSVSLDYQHVKIGAFTEQDQNNQGFNFQVAEQTIESLEGVPGLRMQYTFTPGFGVWVPYIDAQWHHQFKTEPRSVQALYADAQGSLSGAASFVIRTDELDKWYQVYSAGFSAVLRGSSERNGYSAGGLQIYANYRRYDGLQNFSQQVIAAGFRYEF